jgi:uncharacterized membrane protein YebE (DUF533 family)
MNKFCNLVLCSALGGVTAGFVPRLTFALDTRKDLAAMSAAEKNALCLQGRAYEQVELNPPLNICAAIVAAKAAGGPGHNQRIKIESYIKDVYGKEKPLGAEAEAIRREYQRRMSTAKAIAWLAKQTQTPQQAKDVYSAAASVISVARSPTELKKGKAFLKELGQGLNIPSDEVGPINDQYHQLGAE